MNTRRCPSAILTLAGLVLASSAFAQYSASPSPNPNTGSTGSSSSTSTSSTTRTSTTMSANSYDVKNGTIIEGRYDIARGHPEKPLTWNELSEKFRDCATLVLPKRNVDAVIPLLEKFPRLPSIDPLLRLVSSRRRRVRR